MNKQCLKIKILLSIFCLLICQSWVTSSAGLPAVTESQMKAAYLYKFIKYISWAKEAFTNSSTLRICVLADTDPFMGELEIAVKDEKVDGRLLEVKYINRASQINRCHTLFIERSEEANLPEIFSVANQWFTLTISDMDHFVEQGGMIQLFTINNKIGFAIAPETIEKVGLKASAQLLQVAKQISRQD